jgi:hypothetical protein
LHETLSPIILEVFIPQGLAGPFAQVFISHRLRPVGPGRGQLSAEFLRLWFGGDLGLGLLGFGIGRLEIGLALGKASAGDALE